MTFRASSEPCASFRAEKAGNALLIEIAHQHVSDLFAGFGERGLPAESVADIALRQAQAYVASTRISLPTSRPTRP
jgi:RNA 3'-terminal phosphate cyclase